MRSTVITPGAIATGARGTLAGMDDTPDERDAYHVNVLAKALDVLEALVGAGEALGLTDISEKGRMSKPSAFRILATLEKRGYVARARDSRKYLPGTQLIALGASLLRNIDLSRVAAPALEHLVGLFGETSNLAILDGPRIRYVAIVESSKPLRMANDIGTLDMVHSTALGKAYLAAMGPDAARAFVGQLTLSRVTPRTIVDPEELLLDLDRTRKRGHSIDDEENQLGGRCVGAAILDGIGQPVAAVSVSAPLARMPDSLVPVVGRAVQDAAREIAAAMGFASQPDGAASAGTSGPTEHDRRTRRRSKIA